MQIAAAWQNWLLIAALGLAGCQMGPPVQTADSTILRPYVTLSPGSLGHNLSLTQIVTADYDGQNYSMRFEVEVGPTRLVTVGLSHMGIPLFSLEQDGNGLHLETFGNEQMPFDPRHILSDFQLAHWPAATLAQTLAERHLRLEDDAVRSTRRLFSEKGDLLVEITYLVRTPSLAETLIQHFDHPYSLRIKTIQMKETS